MKTPAEEKYPTTISSVRLNLGLHRYDDISFDKEIAQMPRSEVFRRFLNWNGIEGYDVMIRDAIEEIYGVKLTEEK